MPLAEDTSPEEIVPLPGNNFAFDKRQPTACPRKQHHNRDGVLVVGGRLACVEMMYCLLAVLILLGKDNEIFLSIPLLWPNIRLKWFVAAIYLHDTALC